ncbi:MAG: CxC ATPase DNA modification system associated small protein [Cyanobacteriota bacterium]|nr:CxC ATPase DNA modification system associated small protein [Cyanobacteriota bacterium]
MYNFDEKVIAAIREAVREQRQPDKVAKRIEAWLNAISTSELGASEEREYLNNVLNAIKGESDEED